MASKPIWHDRPIIGPIVYGMSTFAAGSLAFTTGYLLTAHIRSGIYAMLFVDGLLVLYLLESGRSARKGNR